MGRRGRKPKRAVPLTWSADVAYAVGLLVTDGCLSGDGRHIDLTSKDLEQLKNFKKCFNLKTPVSYKKSGYTGERTTRLQFSDVILYKFLLEIGLTPAKTKTIAGVGVPEEYFFDFLRGHHDGDGTFFSYWDKRWRSSFMFYLIFISASRSHLVWIQRNLQKLLNVKGHFSKKSLKSTYQLRYAKKESLKILQKIYYDKDVTCLSRKRLKIEKALSIVGERL